MIMRSRNTLFSTNDFSAQLRATQNAMLNEIDTIDADKLLNMSEAALVEYLVDRYRVGVPTLNESAITVAHREDLVRVNTFEYDVPEVNGTWFDYFIPFDGEAAAFKSQALTSSTSGLHGEVVGSELMLSYGVPHDIRADVPQQFAVDLARVKQNLEWLRTDAATHDSQIQDSAHQAVERRRQKLLNDRQQLASLGYPLRERSNASTYAVPTVRPKPKIQRPPGGTVPFAPEPTLAMAEYERILELMANLGRAMELSPSAFRDLNEEDLRTHFLVQLNGQYQGQASGETFNLAGKTDIIIREGERNLFIAECKFWSGPQGLTKAIDQLLSYTSWRDTKTAILLFNRGRQLSAILPKIQETATQHRFCRKGLDYKSETGFRFVFQHPDDSGRELTLTILAFEVPERESASLQSPPSPRRR
jgi:hypothetical protein